MRLKTLSVLLLSALLATPAAYAAGDDATPAFRRAGTLYRNGVYEEARTLFESVGEDPLSEGYVVLCALKMRTPDYPALMEAYRMKYPGSTLDGAIRFENAMLLFDAGDWAAAASEFERAGRESVPSDRVAEYIFKSGYCQNALGNLPEARAFFEDLAALPQNEYSAPGYYLCAEMDYEARDFESAEKLFGLAGTDPRFKDLCDFYTVDCEFNQGNYDTTISLGEKIYADLPAGRKERIARMLSESYLIGGDKEKAHMYYDDLSHQDMNRKDLFYAGTVLYSVDDFRGAVENFSKMEDRSDSLGQLANYHMGNSYIKLRNKVAAMEAFRDASVVDFDKEITEDALFNYAKLAFDLNKDTSGFNDYIKRYSTKAKGDSIYGYMALAALYDRDYAGAIAAYDNIDELAPDMLSNYTKANYLRAEQLIASGSYRDAVPCLMAAAYYLPKTNRFNQLSRYWLAEANYRSGNFEEAGKVFTELFNADALSGMQEGKLLAYNVGYSYFQQGEYGPAARWFDNYCSTGSLLNREDAMVRRADCDFARRDYKAAIASYQKVLDEFYSPDNIYPYYQQALAYGLSGDRKKKLATLEKVSGASANAPMYSDACYELGRTQMELKDNKSAAATFRKLSENAPDNTFKAKALIGLGMVNRNAGNYDNALESYKSVVSLMPGSEYAEDAMLAIESIYQSRKQPEKFLEYVEENRLNANKSEADREKMYFNTAEQVFLAGNYPQAIESARKYLQNYPQGADRERAGFYIAESYREMGDKEKACEAYAAIMDSESGASVAEIAKLRYADLSFSLERYADAYKGYLSLLSSAKIDSNKDEARLGMMRSSYRDRNYQAAIAASDAVMGGKPGKDVQREALYIKAKSSLATSKRDEAMKIFGTLSAESSTAEGAEASYMLSQNLLDNGRFDEVEASVYKFSQNAGEQSYWLARSYIVLGDSFAERGQYAQAKATYESIRDGYEAPRGGDDIADIVRMKLERLSTMMK